MPCSRTRSRGALLTHLLLISGGARAQQLERDVAVGGKHHRVELLVLLSGAAGADTHAAVRHVVHRSDGGAGAHVGQLCTSRSTRACGTSVCDDITCGTDVLSWFVDTWLPPHAARNCAVREIDQSAQSSSSWGGIRSCCWADACNMQAPGSCTQLAGAAYRLPRPAPTCQHLLHVRPAPALDHAPHRALHQVQQVVVQPEAHQRLDRELQDLPGRGGGAAGKGVRGVMMIRRRLAG